MSEVKISNMNHTQTNRSSYIKPAEYLSDLINTIL